jgi:protein-S-isoprenylcysteine O-methyltransferase Ste14
VSKRFLSLPFSLRLGIGAVMLFLGLVFIRITPADSAWSSPKSWLPIAGYLLLGWGFAIALLTLIYGPRTNSRR